MYEDLSTPTTYKKEIKLYTGSGNPELAKKIAGGEQYIISAFSCRALSSRSSRTARFTPVSRSPSAATRFSSCRPSPART